MNQTQDAHPSDDLSASIRAVRARYDRLSRGEIAVLRRCRSADDVALDGTYWRIGGTLAKEQRHLAHVVLLFPLALHKQNPRFAMGEFLRRQLGDEAGAQLRFRRLLDSHDRDDLDHRLRRVLRLACADGTAVDWGVLGKDILWFFAESNRVKRNWAQTFYAPAKGPSASLATPSTPNP